MLRTVPPVFGRYRDQLYAEMRGAVGDGPSLLYPIVRYHLGWQEADGSPGPGVGGKTLRPALCLLAYEGTVAETDASIDSALPAAAAIELIHNFSLVHDDIEDRDERRHNRATAWTLWGEAQAINAGDGMWALANRAFLRTVERGIAPDVALRAFTRLNDACLTMIEGQALDLAFEQRREDGSAPVLVEEYLDMIGRKTGALIATALAIGALLATGDDTVAARFHRMGAHLGRAFQIQDDVLGVWGQGHLTGKSTSSDIRRRKQSYPIVYTLSQGPEAARARLAEVFALPDIDDEAVGAAVHALEQAGARGSAEELARSAYATGMDLLDDLPLHEEARAGLRDLAAFLLERQY